MLEKIKEVAKEIVLAPMSYKKNKKILEENKKELDKLAKKYNIDLEGK